MIGVALGCGVGHTIRVAHGTVGSTSGPGVGIAVPCVSVPVGAIVGACGGVTVGGKGTGVVAEAEVAVAGAGGTVGGALHVGISFVGLANTGGG